MSNIAMAHSFTIGSRQFEFGTRTFIMGILNVTPDSFSDGGRYLDASRAIDRALQMQEEGADIIDIGGESTRPKSSAYGEGADRVSVEEELRRVLPVVSKVASKLSIPISVDTTKSVVAEKALAEGASMINDVSAFSFDPRMVSVIAFQQATAIAMHMLGTPKTMQINPGYDNVTREVKNFLAERTGLARNAGIRQVIIDPGIGFGKRLEDNVALIRHIGEFRSLGCPVMVGVSRKGFIGALTDTPIEARVEGSIAAAIVAATNGADIVRVHDVRETKRALLISDAIIRSRPVQDPVTSA